jgi:hypothetical protein
MCSGLPWMCLCGIITKIVVRGGSGKGAMSGLVVVGVLLALVLLLRLNGRITIGKRLWMISSPSRMSRRLLVARLMNSPMLL